MTFPTRTSDRCARVTRATGICAFENADRWRAAAARWPSIGAVRRPSFCWNPVGRGEGSRKGRERSSHGGKREKGIWFFFPFLNLLSSRSSVVESCARWSSHESFQSILRWIRTGTISPPSTPLPRPSLPVMCQHLSSAHVLAEVPRPSSSHPHRSTSGSPLQGLAARSEQRATQAASLAARVPSRIETTRFDARRRYVFELGLPVRRPVAFQADRPALGSAAACRRKRSC